MDVLVTGPFGRVGTAIIDHLHDRDGYDFGYFDKEAPDEGPYAEYDAIVGDVVDYDAIRSAMEGRDAVVHLAAYPHTDATWDQVVGNNIVGTYNTLEAAADAGVEAFVFASSNHAVGMYEVDNAPEIYYPGHGIVVDHTVPTRPDTYYGASKCFGEDLLRYYVERRDSPERGYALRICSLRHGDEDHPYGPAERGVEAGDWERGSDAYGEAVARMKAMWHSRRDFAHLVDCCLRDEAVEFDVFYGVSDNRRRWFDIEHARAVLGYDPQDDGEEWDAPPA